MASASGFDDMSLISAQGLAKSFRTTAALRAVDIEVAEGEVLALLGPTGAGKTTTLRCLAGLEKPDRGRIFMDGQDVTSASPRERDVAVVFEGYNLLPTLSVFDNIAFPLRSPIYKESESEIERRVKRTAADLRIDHLLERHRGRALCRDPRPLQPTRAQKRGGRGPVRANGHAGGHGGLGHALGDLGGHIVKVGGGAADDGSEADDGVDGTRSRRPRRAWSPAPHGTPAVRRRSPGCRALRTRRRVPRWCCRARPAQRSRPRGRRWRRTYTETSRSTPRATYQRLPATSGFEWQAG